MYYIVATLLWFGFIFSLDDVLLWRDNKKKRKTKRAFLLAQLRYVQEQIYVLKYEQAKVIQIRNTHLITREQSTFFREEYMVELNEAIEYQQRTLEEMGERLLFLQAEELQLRDHLTPGDFKKHRQPWE